MSCTRAFRAGLGRPAGTYDARARRTEEVRHRDAELVRQAHKAAEGEILHAQLDALQIVGGDAELLGQLLLGESRTGA